MMGRSGRDQGQLFFSFNLEEVVPDDHLVRGRNGSSATQLSGCPQARPIKYLSGYFWHENLYSAAKCSPPGTFS